MIQRNSKIIFLLMFVMVHDAERDVVHSAADLITASLSATVPISG